MAEIKISALPNITTPNTPVIFNPEFCVGCNTCVNVCQVDVFIPNPEKGCPPIVLHPDECWYCGCCVEDCPREGAITMVHPLHATAVVAWKRKDSGEHFRLGMKDPPPANERPPSG